MMNPVQYSLISSVLPQGQEKSGKNGDFEKKSGNLTI